MREYTGMKSWNQAYFRALFSPLPGGWYRCRSCGFRIGVNTTKQLEMELEIHQQKSPLCFLFVIPLDEKPA